MSDEPLKPEELVVTQEDLDANPVLAENGVKVGDVGVETDEPVTGKPVGPATIVQDDPIEQFPAHDENITSK